MDDEIDANRYPTRRDSYSALISQMDTSQVPKSTNRLDNEDQDQLGISMTLNTPAVFGD